MQKYMMINVKIYIFKCGLFSYRINGIISMGIRQSLLFLYLFTFKTLIDNATLVPLGIRNLLTLYTLYTNDARN